MRYNGKSLKDLQGGDRYYKQTYDFAPGGKYLVVVEPRGAHEVADMEEWKKMAKEATEYVYKIEPITGPIPKY